MAESDLTKREREVLLLAADGLTDKEIAERLGVAPGTIATHWVRMRERSGAVNRAQIIARTMAETVREQAAEQHRLGEIYRSLIETLDDFAIFLMDESRTVLSWNPGVEKILRYREDDWTGQAADRIYTPEDRAANVPAQEQETARREGKAMDERWHQRKDGSRFWCSGVLVAIRDEEGEIVCFSKILRDLTHLKRAEDRLRELGEDLESL